MAASSETGLKPATAVGMSCFSKTKFHSSGPMIVETWPGATNPSKPGVSESSSIATAGHVRRPDNRTDKFFGTPSNSMAATGAVVVRTRQRKKLPAAPDFAARLLPLRADLQWVAHPHLRPWPAPANAPPFSAHYRHAQHVAKGNQNYICAQCELNRLVHILFRAHAYRTAGPGYQFDGFGERASNACHGDRALMPAAHVHDAHAIARPPAAAHGFFSASPGR